MELKVFSDRAEASDTAAQFIALLLLDTNQRVRGAGRVPVVNPSRVSYSTWTARFTLAAHCSHPNG